MPLAVKLGTLGRGDVFLLMQGEERTLGLVTRSSDGDRGPGTVHYITELGHKQDTPDFGGPEVIKLDEIKDLGNNPLRDLLNWAAKYGG